ncbi:MAG: hypothetical protein JWM19_1024 [Actinomycetia bacterium]|nr:hypothetical protein [Actinomycetes bacterium]
MVDEPDLVALLYRADWTRLSLSAQVHEVIDWALKMEVGRPARPPSYSLIKIGDLPPMERDPPGFRVKHSDGGLLDELPMPHAMRSAMRSAGSAAKAAGSAAIAARSFIDSLRGQRG